MDDGERCGCQGDSAATNLKADASDALSSPSLTGPRKDDDLGLADLRSPHSEVKSFHETPENLILGLSSIRSAPSGCYGIEIGLSSSSRHAAISALQTDVAHSISQPGAFKKSTGRGTQPIPHCQPRRVPTACWARAALGIPGRCRRISVSRPISMKAWRGDRRSSSSVRSLRRPVSTIETRPDQALLWGNDYGCRTVPTV